MKEKIVIRDMSRRHCFYRGETAVMRFDVMNFHPRNLTECRFRAELNGKEVCPERKIPVLGTFLSGLSLPLETTNLHSGRYLLKLTLSQSGSPLAEHSVPIALTPPRREGAMALWHWPSTVHYNALEAGRESALEQLRLLAETGFTWCQMRGEWALRHYAEAVELIEEGMMLGLEVGILIENTGGGLFRFQEGDPEEARLISSDGKDPVLVNAFHPAVEHRIQMRMEQLMTLFGEFPSCTTIFMNSEVEDKLKLALDPETRAFHEKNLGFSLEKIAHPDIVFQEKLPGAETGILPDDDPEYRFAEYYFKRGDGFTHMNKLLSDVAHRYRPDITTISDPFRICAVYDRFRGVDAVSSWTYTNPDPKAALFVETLAAEAKPEHKAVIPTITLWNYPGTLVPSGMDRFAREYTLRMGPDRYSECAWINFSRGVNAIGNYFGSPIELTLRGGDPFLFSPETERAIASFASRVLKPFGAFARKTRAVPRKIAVLDSLASRVYGCSPRPYNHYQNYAIHNFHTILAMAHLPADILFDESIRSGALESYDVLALPCCDTLTEQIYASVLAFVRRGGIVIADQYLRAEIPGAIRFRFDFEYRKRVNANANARGFDFTVKDDTNFRREWNRTAADGVPADRDQEILESYAAELRRVLDPVLPPRTADCSSPRILIHEREYDSIPYLFLTNDNRTWGDRVGEWKSMLEKGVPETADFLLRCPEGDSVLYELISGKRIACKKQDGMLSFSLTIPSASGAILALYPAEPEKMEIEGTTLKSVFRRGLQVVKITETDAAGKEGDYNGYYLAENGLLKLPPRDFPAGQLEIRELTTGERMLIHGENPGGARSSARHDPQ